MENAAVSYVTYLWQMIYPSGLACLYPNPTNYLPLWEVAGAVGLLLAISGAALVISPDTSLAGGRLALVFGDDDSGDRDGADILTTPMRIVTPICRRSACICADLAGGGFVRRLASPPLGCWRALHGHSGGFDFLRAQADLLLAKQ